MPPWGLAQRLVAVFALKLEFDEVFEALGGAVSLVFDAHLRASSEKEYCGEATDVEPITEARLLAAVNTAVEGR